MRLGDLCGQCCAILPGFDDSLEQVWGFSYWDEGLSRLSSGSTFGVYLRLVLFEERVSEAVRAVAACSDI